MGISHRDLMMNLYKGKLINNLVVMCIYHPVDEGTLKKSNYILFEDRYSKFLWRTLLMEAEAGDKFAAEITDDIVELVREKLATM